MKNVSKKSGRGNVLKVRLGDIAVQDRTIIDPDSTEAERLSYLGLEQIEAQTGRVLSYQPGGIEGKSTTFAFDARHVLYGKLRPYLNKVALPEFQGRCSTEIIPLLPQGIDREFLAFMLRKDEVVSAAMSAKTGSRMPRADMDALLNVKVIIPEAIDDQRRIAARLKEQLTAVEEARRAAETQVDEITQLANAVVRQSVLHPDTESACLGEVLEEVKKGIGATWDQYPVMGYPLGSAHHYRLCVPSSNPVTCLIIA